MFKILIYGAGDFAGRYFDVTMQMINQTDIELIGYVDKNQRKQEEGFHGYNVYSPNDLAKITFDQIYIYAFEELYEKIYKSLYLEYQIEPDKISGIEGLLHKAQEYYRKNNKSIQKHPVRIYDCLTFFNEIELLKIRMKILNPYVDYFVIVEMCKDHHGRDKTYCFLEHRDEFAEYEEKIIYVQPKNLPLYEEKEGLNWILENFQRRSIKDGLVGAGPEDYIMISDCDEIPNPQIIKEIRENIGYPYKNVYTKILKTDALALRQEYYYYFLNCRRKKSANTTTIVKYKNMIDAHLIRTLMAQLTFVENGGWHLTSFGGVEQIYLKTQSIVEGEKVDKKTIEERIKKGLDIYGRTESVHEMEFVEKKDINIPYLNEILKEHPEFYFENNN